MVLCRDETVVLTFYAKKAVSYRSPTVTARLFFCVTRSRREWFHAKGRTARSPKAERGRISERRPVWCAFRSVYVQRGQLCRIHVMVPRGQLCATPLWREIWAMVAAVLFSNSEKTPRPVKRQTTLDGSEAPAALMEGICERRYTLQRQDPV
ncbi:hypothetical protein MRX96_002132 [Rhipicephalus microplus]